MISDSELLALSSRHDDYFERPKLGIDGGAPGWVTDAVFALNIGHVPDGAGPWWSKASGALAELVERHRKAKPMPVVELESLYVPSTMPKCHVCKGKGTRRYDVPDDEIKAHVIAECDWCDGAKVVFKQGQVVYADAVGNKTILAPKLKCLFDGLHVVRLDGAKGEPVDISHRPLGGLNTAGELVAIVMPVSAAVVVPKKRPHVARL